MNLLSPCSLASLLLLAACDPGTEICGDGIDNDHDALVDCFDDDCSAESACAESPDADGDGITVDEGDCDDGDPTVNPSATELCNGVDDDCDGDVDEDDAADASTWYLDNDGDSFGASTAADAVACNQPTGFVDNTEDCDDDDPDVHPDADELCDEIDNDCDELLDDEDPDIANTITWYLDYDGDGWGADSGGIYELVACDQPSGYADNTEDCDDLDASVYPDAVEVCDSVDQDCDGTVDEETECYDDDGDCQCEPWDGEGANASNDDCVGSVDPSCEELSIGDCDDEDASVYSGVVSTHEGIEMATICPGTFIMGSPEDEMGREDDETQHLVTLTRGFLIGAYELTQEAFEELVGYQNSMYGDCPNCPAENMSWYEAAAVANAVSDTAGLDACYDCSGSGTSVSCTLKVDYSTAYDCEGYRLPTEAEWEFAARAGTTSAFSDGGNLHTGDEQNCDGNLALDNGVILDEIAWYCGNYVQYTEETGTRAPNPWRLYDMHGNVKEWCQDAWDLADYAGDATDPMSTTGAYRTLRGGDYTNEPHGLRSAWRGRFTPDSIFGRLGLRLARTATEE